MAIANTVESLDKVEIEFRGAYVLTDGKYVLDADRYADLKTQGLKNKTKQLLDRIKETQPIENRVAELEAEVRQYKLTTPLRKIIAESGVFPDMVDLVLLDTQKRFALDEETGRIVTLDEHGDPINISPESFFKTLYMQQRPRFFKASEAGGSGAKSGSKARDIDGKTMTRDAFDRMSQEQKMAFSLGGGELIET